jgi:hypothetical protein
MILKLDSPFAGFNECQQDKVKIGASCPFRPPEHDMSACTVTTECLFEQGYQIPGAYIQYTQEVSSSSDQLQRLDPAIPVGLPNLSTCSAPSLHSRLNTVSCTYQQLHGFHLQGRLVSLLKKAISRLWLALALHVRQRPQIRLAFARQPGNRSDGRTA